MDTQVQNKSYRAYYILWYTHNFIDMDKIEKLLTSIQNYNAAYRAGDTKISDAEYDKLVDELRRVDPDNEWFKQIEPVNVTKSRKVKLPIPMKSLNKVKDAQSLRAWAKSIGLLSFNSVVITPKFDGLSLLHDEKTGMAYSRGGAENEGQDCTAHYQTASNITNSQSALRFTFGEFVFSRESWTMNFAGKKSPDTGDIYKSPRNTAAGFLNRDEPSDNLKFIDFFRYGTDEESLNQFQTYEELYSYLCSQFNQPNLYATVTVDELTTELCQTLYKEWSQQYYIDGLVVYANNLNIWSYVGRQETTGNPNYAIAYKDPSFTETFETIVKGITWKINKAGALKPVVNIEVVDTGDCSMENPTGYNAGWIYDHRIAKGAKILVTRSGGVIPKILETITPAPTNEEDKQWEELCYCPHCHASTKWNQKQIELTCTNPYCCGVQLAKIVFFFKTLEAEYLGEETLTKIFNAGFQKLNQILNITFDELLDIESFGEATANQVLNAIERIKGGVEITHLMHASDCFNGIGQIKAKTILSQLPKDKRLAFYNGRFHEWKDNDELQTKEYFVKANTTLKSFMLGIIPFYDFVAQNKLQILPMEESPKATGSSCHGLRVCFTGIRDTALEASIKANGGEIVSGVSKKTTHLIVADKNSQSSKAIKAKQNNIPIVTIEEFIAKYPV